MPFKYESLVDRYAHQQHRLPDYEKKTDFGQLQHIFVVHISPSASLNLLKPVTIFLAAIKTCEVEAFNSLNARYYSKLGPLEVVDMACVQCVVGRVQVGRRWAIIDRSGTLSLLVYDEADGEETLD